MYGDKIVPNRYGLVAALRLGAASMASVPHPACYMLHPLLRLHRKQSGLPGTYRAGPVKDGGKHACVLYRTSTAAAPGCWSF